MNTAVARSSEVGHESGYVKGVAVAIVTQNKDEDGLCRVKVRFPWHDKPRESYWARLAMPMAGDGRGTVFIPEVDDEVLVAFEREDLRFPYVLGALWNGKDKPPLANDDGKTTGASSSRARSTTCCSTTARKASSSLRMKTAPSCASPTTRSN